MPIENLDTRPQTMTPGSGRRRSPIAPLGALALGSALALGLTACSPEGTGATDDDAGTDTPSDSAPEPEDAGSDAGSDPAAVLGTVTVDGIDYEITEIRNCEPYEVEGIDVSLELQGLGTADGERVQIDVYQQTIGGAPMDDVSWAGPEGVFGGPDDAQLTVGDGRVSGSATLVDALEQVDTVSIAFDLPVPAETISCR